MAFHLPGAELRPVTGFHHNISTGDSPPVEVEDEPPENPVKALSPVNSELRQVADEFGKHLNSLPTKTATASQACKFVYGAYLQAQEILNCHGKLRGLVKFCPYLSMQGASHGGTYLLSLNQDLFTSVMRS